MDKKKKKATINPKHLNDTRFQYMGTISLRFDDDETKKDAQRVSNTKPFIKNCSWEGINYPSKNEDWRRFEKNNPTIALNAFHFNKMYTPLISQKSI